jgi:hypothetical protein
MGLLIGYVLGFLINATWQMHNSPDYVGSTKIILASLFYPLTIFFLLTNVILYPFGVSLQFKAGVLLSEKEMQKMTDKQMENISDILKKLEELDEEEDEK